MSFKGVIGFTSILISAGFSQGPTVKIVGKVSDATSKAIAGAKIELAIAKVSATSGADGSYSINNSVSILQGRMGNEPAAMRFEQGVLSMTVFKTSPVRVEIFDAHGNLLDRQSWEHASAGRYDLDLSGKVSAENMLVVRASVGSLTQSFPYLAMTQGQGLTRVNLASRQAVLAKVAAVVDTLKVSASGYTAKSIAITSYDTTVNINLVASSGDRWGGLKNAPVKSTGCGKELSVISKSGTYHIASSGGRGDYIIDIPTNYDKNKPYQLVFGNHCLGANAQRVAAKDNGDDLSGYYSIKTLADKDGIPGIYVAMQGDAGGTWSLPNDSKFWNDVYTLVEANLCVDITRVFVTGFSFGAMFSYVLSLEYPEKIRAVATYAPANYNMTQPTNRHIPIAYYQTTGTTDGTCPWVNNESQKRGGKFCLLQHMEDNGCTSTASDIKLATGGTHVVNEFKGCKEGYPVKFSSFNAGHQAVHTDQGSSGNWIEKEAWEFFKQF